MVACNFSVDKCNKWQNCIIFDHGLVEINGLVVVCGTAVL